MDRESGDSVDRWVQAGEWSSRGISRIQGREQVGQKGNFPGQNKEAFDAEAFAILQAFNHLDDRGERGRQYTVFSDSQVAIARAQHDRTGPGQALAKGAIRAVDNIISRDNSITLRWPQPMQESSETSRLMRRPREQQREEREGPHHLTCWRRVWPVLPERPPRPDRQPRQSGFGAIADDEDDTDPLRGGGEKGTEQDQEGVSGPVLPAPVRPCGGGRAPGENRPGPSGHLLVLWHQ